MDFRQLKYFVQIAESGNFSRAAEVLRIAQPSLSQQMKHLEEELGVDLLVRHARGVTTTELGQQFYDHARRILQEMDRAKDVIRSQSLNPSGRVSVGLPTSACRGLSFPLFEAMAARQPNITLHLVEAMTSYLDDYIQAGRLDVALLYDHKAFEHVAWTEMMVEDLMLFVSPDSDLAREGAIPFRRLADLPIVLPGRPNVLRTVMEQFAARCDTRLAPFDCDSLPAIVK
ncbi:MAG: LysR family transcriptional regulator, partial [Rhizobiales bacterium 17-65-6]